MLRKTWSALGPTRFELLIFSVCAGSLLPILLPVLEARHLIGWDTPAHRFFTAKMAELLGRGQVSAYIPEWDGGLPAFYFYPPLFFILSALPACLFPTLVSPELSFNAAVFLAPFLFLGAVWFCGVSFLGRIRGAALLPLGITFLLLEPFGAQGIGLTGLLITGLIPSFYGVICFALYFGLLVRALRSQSSLLAVVCGVALGAVILTHLLTAIFALGCTLLVVVLGVGTEGVTKGEAHPYFGTLQWSTAATTVAIVFITGGAVSAWWWVPFIRNLWLSSGSLVPPQNFGDPLTWFFPFGENVTPNSHTGRLVMGLQRVTPGWSQFFPPWYGALAGGLSIGGLLCSLRRGEVVLPLTLLASLLLLSGGFLAGLYPIPIHAYRFAGPLWVVHLLLAALGLESVAARIPSDVPWRPFRTAMLILSIGLALQAVMGSSIGLFEAFRDGPQKRTFDGRKLPEAGIAEQLLKSLQGENDGGRIVVESDEQGLYSIGSPHYLIAEIPQQIGRPVLPGIFTESSLSAPFIIPTLRNLSDQLTWGDAEISEFDEMIRQTPKEMVQRLRLFGASQLLASSQKLTRSLTTCGDCNVRELARAGRRVLFSLGSPRTPIVRLEYKPLLFVDHGGLDFRAFSKLLFIDPRALDLHIFFRPGGLTEITPQERALLGGVIVSFARGSSATPAELAEWSTLGPVYLLNHGPSFPHLPGAQVFPVTQFFRTLDVKPFVTTLSEGIPRFGESTEVSGAGYLSAQFGMPGSGAYVIRFNYFPTWHGCQESQGVRPFFVTPSFVGVLASQPAAVCY